jgi:hypothetical protein
MPICLAAIWFGSNCTRTAYFCEPMTSTWATPLIIEMRWAKMVCANSSTADKGSVSGGQGKKQ